MMARAMFALLFYAGGQRHDGIDRMRPVTTVTELCRSHQLLAGGQSDACTGFGLSRARLKGELGDFALGIFLVKYGNLFNPVLLGHGTVYAHRDGHDVAVLDQCGNL